MDDKYKALSAPMPEESIQRTKKEKTKKGYDTTGVGYQFCVNRFNEIFGLEGWGFTYQVIKEEEGKFGSGQPCYSITVNMSIWIGKPENARTAPGGHTSVSYADALKGAMTNAFKKAAAFWGVGRQAYEGSLDDDNEHRDEGEADVRKDTPEAMSEKQRPMIEDVLKSHLLKDSERHPIEKKIEAGAFTKAEASRCITWWFGSKEKGIPGERDKRAEAEKKTAPTCECGKKMKFKGVMDTTYTAPNGDKFPGAADMWKCECGESAVGEVRKK